MREAGFVESNPFLYGKVKQMGVIVHVWDDIPSELFDLPTGSIADSFGNILFNL